MIDFLKSYFSLKMIECGYSIDTVSGKSVNIYKDCFNDIYIKTSKYSLFQANIDKPYLNRL